MRDSNACPNCFHTIGANPKCDVCRSVACAQQGHLRRTAVVAGFALAIGAGLSALWTGGSPPPPPPPPPIRVVEAPAVSKVDGNLLANPSFEGGLAGWKTWSYLPADRAEAVKDRGHSGNAVVLLASGTENDVFVGQTVPVKRKHKYLLSGWIRTLGVKVVQARGRTGANLAVWGSWECTPSLVGDHEWTYQSLVFDTGERTSIQVGPRLGHHGSTAVGKAWFDDLQLVDLGTLPGEDDFVYDAKPGDTAGAFRDHGTGRWLEYKPSLENPEQIIQFRETARRPGLVQLRDDSRGMNIRLSGTRCEFSLDGNPDDWNVVHYGRWASR